MDNIDPATADPGVTPVNNSLVQETISKLKQAGHIPVFQHSYELAGEIYELYRNQFFLSEEAKELLYIMSQHHIRAMFDVHDRVANHEYLPVLPDILPQCDDDDRVMKIVKLYKNDEPLGVTIKNRESDGMICVARVFVGGPAESSGLVEAGDEIHEVNGIPVKGRTIEEVVHILNSCDGTISLKLVPDIIDQILPKAKVKIKAHFSYNPDNDLLIPCKDAGLPFRNGDILEILSTDDSLWWQARLLYDDTNRTGLIPSRTLQTRRSTELYNNSVGRGVPNSPSLHRKISPPTASVSHNMGSLLSPRLQRKSRKSKKLRFRANIIDGDIEFSVIDEAESETQLKCLHQKIVYEEVQLYRPPPGQKRPIIILGTPHVGTHDLKQKLVKENQGYASPTAVTSRPKKLLETDGKDFNFISKAEMDKLLQEQRMLEYGEYKGNLYGITLDSIYSTIQSGKTCVLVCQPQSLAALRCARFKPLVVLVKPPSLDKLKQLKAYAGTRSITKLTINEIEEMVLRAAMIEAMFGDSCDETIVNMDFNQSYNQLLSISLSANSTQNWVPSIWLD